MKPLAIVRLVGEDGNIFAILGRAGSALRAAGYANEAREMWNRAVLSKSYEEALAVILEYVHDEITGLGEGDLA